MLSDNIGSNFFERGVWSDPRKEEHLNTTTNIFYEYKKEAP